MLENLSIRNILFLDIETAPMVASYADVDDNMRKLWEEKHRSKIDEQTSGEELWNSDGGLMAEFSKIICISVGVLRGSEELSIHFKSFFGDDEHKILSDFAKLLNKSYSYPGATLCAHNGKNFDFPVLARRMLINKIKLPTALDIAGKKPWEIPHIDTMELWRFGDFKNYTSLKLLCGVFGIPSPKDDITGADVAKVYYTEHDLNKIVQYCEKDVKALIQVYLRISEKHNIKIKEDTL